MTSDTVSEVEESKMAVTKDVLDSLTAKLDASVAKANASAQAQRAARDARDSAQKAYEQAVQQHKSDKSQIELDAVALTTNITAFKVVPDPESDSVQAPPAPPAA